MLEVIEYVGWAIIGLFTLCWAIVVSIYLLGIPGFVLHKLVKSKFGNDVLFPLKSIASKFRQRCR